MARTRGCLSRGRDYVILLLWLMAFSGIMSNQADTTAVESLRILLEGFNAANEALLSRDGRVEFSFPRIVVIGDQSHGKSSVISRVTNIRLPSKDGTCTRAPLHIASRLSRDGTCKARLSFPEAAAKSSTHLVPRGWKLENHDGTLKYVKPLLSDGAQWPPQEQSVLAAVDEATTALVGNVANGMSGAEMLLEWESPQTFTLDVVDLPGFADLADAIMSEGIKDVVQKYIHEPNSIIMCVFGSDTPDLQTFKALNAARQETVDPSLKRTLIVFTRLDKLQDGEQEKRLRQHLNDLFDTHQYKPLDVFLVKNTGGNADLVEQQAREDDFLPRWRDLQQAERQAESNLKRIKLGVPELVGHLQRLLTSRLEQELPKLLSKLQRDVERTEAELQSIPVIATPSQASAKARELAKKLLTRLTVIRNGIFSQTIQARGDVTDASLVYNRLLLLHEDWFTTKIVVPNYMDAEKWGKLLGIYQKHAGKEMRGDIDVDTRRHFYLETFANDLSDHLKTLAEHALIEVQESYEEVVDDVFSEYSKLRSEIKSALYDRVLKPQTAALMDYLHHTAKAQEDFHTCSSIYEAGRDYYYEYLRGTAESVEAKRGALGVEDLLVLGQKGPGHKSLTDALEFHKAQFLQKAEPHAVNLMQAQWEVLLYTVLVHNSLYDTVPRIIRKFLVHELIDDKLDTHLIDLVGLPGKMEKLGDEEWLHAAMVEPEVWQVRMEKEQQLRKMKQARINLENARDMWQKMKGMGGMAATGAVLVVEA